MILLFLVHLVASLFCLSVGQEFCGKITVYKEKWFYQANVLDNKKGLELDKCILECCALAGCGAVGYSDFLVSVSGAECSLLSCERPEGCVAIDRPSNSTGLLSIEITRENASSSVAAATTTAASENGTEVANAGVSFGIKSCSTVIGIAIFLAVFCTAINLGLVANLVTARRLGPPANGPVRPPATDKVAANKRSEPLHAYNNVVVDV